MPFEISIVLAFGISIALMAFAIAAFRKTRKRKRWLRLRGATHEALASLFTASGALALTHANALASQFRTKAYRDPYGNLVLDDWYHELDYFIDRIVIPRLQREGLILRFEELRKALALSTFFEMAMGEAEANRYAGTIKDILRGWLREEFPRILSLHPGADTNAALFAEGRDGGEYEQRCEALLRNAGWTVWRRGKSGDQGIDLVAEREGLSIGIQCKNHAEPVGNGSVQEAFTGARILGTHFAAVVSDSGFTKSARVAATSTNVLLLTTEQLSQLNLRVLPQQT